MAQSKESPHSRSLRLHRQMEGPGTFFVTKNLQPRNPTIDEAIASEICETLCFYAEKNEISLAAFVVMLDHWHALLATCDGKTISTRMKLLGRWLSRKTGARQDSVREAVPICLWLYRREPSSGRIGEDRVRLAVVVGQCPLSRQPDPAMAMEI